MATRLVKALLRRIGGWIVELSQTHLTVRRVRHKTAVRIALADLITAVDQVKAPRGWVPQVGDTVAVGSNRHRARVAAVIPSSPELLVRVRFPKGTERQVELSSLVPVGNRKVLIECVIEYGGIPKDGTTEPSRTLF